MDDKLVTYGGQAIIEGVMMRGRKTCAMAMRAPDGSITTKVELLGGIYKSRLAKIPFLRGLILLWDSLGLGMHALTDSANLQTGEDEKIEGPVLYLTLGLTFLVAIGIFFLAPAGVGWLSEHFLHWNAWWSNLLEGIIRLLLLLGYMWGIGSAPDIARVFAYHGAEHKTINAYEANAPLTVNSVKLSVNEATKDPEKRNLAAAQAAVDACFASADYVEGRTAFMEKRKPVFRAR